MIEFGETLKKAREARGLTVEQVAEATHMMVRMVEDLEKENFTRIAAPIYGRGYVKLYCEAVGIDPKPLVAEFMDILNGNRPTTIRMRQPSPPPVEPQQAEPAAAEPAPEEPAPNPPEPVSTDFSLEQETVAAQPALTPISEQRYHTPEPIERERGGFRLPTPPPAFWRILALAAVAALVVWGIVAGVKALYSATMTPPGEEQSATAEPPNHQTTEPPNHRTTALPNHQTTTPRTPISIPPLYID